MQLLQVLCSPAAVQNHSARCGMVHARAGVLLDGRAICQLQLLTGDSRQQLGFTAGD